MFWHTSLPTSSKHFFKEKFILRIKKNPMPSLFMMSSEHFHFHCFFWIIGSLQREKTMLRFEKLSQWRGWERVGMAGERGLEQSDHPCFA